MGKKQWYTVSFSAKMTKEDVRSMKHYFYQAMEELMQIGPCVALDIELEDDQDEDDDIPTTDRKALEYDGLYSDKHEI